MFYHYGNDSFKILLILNEITNNPSGGVSFQVISTQENKSELGSMFFTCKDDRQVHIPRVNPLIFSGENASKNNYYEVMNTQIQK